MISIRGPFQRKAGRILWKVLPRRSRQALLKKAAQADPASVIVALGSVLNRAPNLGNMPFDLPDGETLRFEHLAGLFANMSCDFAVVCMSVRQTAYLYGMVRSLKARKVIEIGRYKGGSTLAIAAAMEGRGEFWSIDIGNKVSSLLGKDQLEYDAQLKEILKQHRLQANLIIGDSRTLELDTGEVDLVFIDGDHSYPGVKNDFDRFGRRVRPGGAVLLDDAFSDKYGKAHDDTVGRLVNEVVSEGEFVLEKRVHSMAHLKRVKKPSNG